MTNPNWYVVHWLACLTNGDRRSGSLTAPGSSIQAVQRSVASLIRRKLDDVEDVTCSASGPVPAPDPSPVFPGLKKHKNMTPYGPGTA